MKHIALEKVDVFKIHVFENDDELKNYTTCNYSHYLHEDDTRDKELWNELINKDGKLFSWEVEV